MVIKQIVVCIFDSGQPDLWPSDPKINRCPLLPRMDVWTMYEKGRSRHSRDIHWNGLGEFDLWPWAQRSI